MKLALVALALMLAPLAASAPATCADPCVVEPEAQLTYVAPVVAIASGSSVVWRHSDGYGHLQQDGKNFGDSDFCFSVAADAGDTTSPVLFELVDGTLYATSADWGTLPCTNAAVTPAGAALPYYCVLHNTMRGTIVVTSG